MEHIQRYQQLEHHNDLLKQVIDQLNKDFGSNVIEMHWDAENHNPYQDFIQKVETVVGKLLEYDKPNMMSILYRIDVFESKLRVFWTLDPKDRVSKLTELILNRELQKVITRNWYKQK